MIAALLLIIPLTGILLSCSAALRSEALRDKIYRAELVLVFFLALAALICCLQGNEQALQLPGICALGLSLRLDGFRSLYVLVASFMWLMTGLMSGEYFIHYKNRTRYYLFNQITLFATLGVFMSDDLMTTFIFFEIMSLSSYPWVVHDENEGAMKAGKTYLAIAVFGGMVTLMGLFMAYRCMGSLRFEDFAAARGRADMNLPAALILVGFAAKAGLFPLHIWLPQAHPVAPAPASALLSGVLTKTGVFGMLVICLRLLTGSIPFGNVMLALGLTTMLLGALLALFSTNLKRILACSSMSQIDYITVGISMAMLLGEHGSIPASGAVMHMVNHSILKLTLFMAAGVVYMKLHKLELNDIRGFGRGKPLLHAAFLLGSLGLAGVPLFNVYPSKTLIHEGILEYAHHIGHFSIYNICEWIFLFAAGITTAYMLKIYIALFHQKHPSRQKEFDALNGGYMSRTTSAVLCASMLLIPVLGIFPGILETISRMSEGFTGFHGVSGVHYFSFANLKGGGISLLIGVLLYLIVVRKFLCSRAHGYISVELLNTRPQPSLVQIFMRTVDGLCMAMDHVLENRLFLCWIPDACTALTRCAAELTDGAVLLLRNTLFRSRTEHRHRKHWGYYVFSSVAGHMLNAFVFLLNLSFYRNHPIRIDFVYVLAARVYDHDPEFARATRTVSFGLMLFALGFLVALIYLIVLEAESHFINRAGQSPQQRLSGPFSLLFFFRILRPENMLRRPGAVIVPVKGMIG